MKLAIFDLDNTLLGGDSDYLWGQFLVERGIVDRDEYERENKRFYDDYVHGRLDIDEFLAFALRPLAEHPRDRLDVWHDEYLREKITPILQDKAGRLIDSHRRDGATLLIITATNRFVTAPIARLLGIEHLLATDPEIVDGRFTGRVAGIPCFREGKVTRLDAWLKEQGMNLAESWFYSDSHNDLPLLERVTHPVAVDPDDTLRQHAQMKGWPVMTLRNERKEERVKD